MSDQGSPYSWGREKGRRHSHYMHSVYLAKISSIYANANCISNFRRSNRRRFGVRCPNGHLPATAECTHRGLSYLWVPVPHTYTAAAKQARDWARFKLQYLTVLTVPIANNAAWWYSLKGAQQRLQFARTIQLFQFTPSYVCLQASIPQMQLPRLAMAPWALGRLLNYLQVQKTAGAKRLRAWQSGKTGAEPTASRESERRILKSNGRATAWSRRCRLKF